MPYTLNTAPAATKSLPKGAKEIWVAAFNSAAKQYDDEGRAFATAWAAVRRKYKQSDGKWIEKGQRMAKQVLYEDEVSTIVRVDKADKDLDAQVSRVRNAFYERHHEPLAIESSKDAWVSRVFDDAIIVEDNANLYRIEYTEDADGAITFGEPVKVEIEYKPVAKSARAKVAFVKADDEKHLVYGIVMEPDAIDTEGDKTSADEIEKAAHGFMLDFQDLDLNHERVLGKQEASIVESYIAPQDLTFGENLVPAGTWMMVTKVFDDEIWKSVKEGDLTGYSIVGWGIRKPAEDA